MNTNLRDRWALVTGSSRGVGREIARGLARRGCHLVLHARKEEHLSDLAQELSEQVQVRIVAADLAQDEPADRLIAAVLAAGGVDVLYNNAAIMTPFREPYSAVTTDDYRRCFAVNFLAPVRITHGLLPHMLAGGFGRVVQVTSGIQGQPELMAYAASKAALDKFVRDTAPRLGGSGVTMNLLDPGWLRTDLGGPQAPNAVESVLPGALVPALVGDDVQGRWFSAQDYVGQAI